MVLVVIALFAGLFIILDIVTGHTTARKGERVYGS